MTHPLPTRKVGVVDHAEAGRIIRRKRKESKIKLCDLAKEIDITPSYLSDLEKGKRNWTEERFDDACEAIAKWK